MSGARPYACSHQKKIKGGLIVVEGVFFQGSPSLGFQFLCSMKENFMANLQKNLEQILTPSSFTNFPGNILTNFKIVGFQHNVEITHVGTGTNSSQTMF